MQAIKIVENNIFIVAGMPRTATTFLYYQLQKHPRLFAPVRKEMNFFSTLYGRGANWYLGYYSSMRGDQIGMDISPAYFLDAETSIHRMLKFNPQMKVVLGIRDAADWIFSFLGQLKTQLNRPPSFKQLFSEFTIERSGEALTLNFGNDRIPRSIELFRKAFGKNLFIYRYELFKEDPLRLLKLLEKFLGVEVYFNQTNYRNLIINASNRKNIKVLSMILRNEKVISFAKSAVPQRFIRYLQNRRLERSAGPQEEIKQDEYLVTLAQNFFENQQKYIDQLFLNSGFLLGDGSVVTF